MLDKVCSRTKFHLTYFDAKVWIFHVRLIWWAVSSSIHKFSLISNVCTFKLQFEFLNVFLNFEFRFNHKYLLRMRKAQDHVLQQRWIRYTRYNRESLRKPSERKWYCKKGQIKRREALDGWGNVSADRYVRRKPCLWDVFDKEYTKRDVKEIVYTERESSLDTNIQSIKAKINGLRAQLGREVAKVNKTKIGQSTDELYASSWIHYDRLSFLLPVIKSSKSGDTLKRNNEEEMRK